MTPRVRSLVAAVETARAVAGYLELRPDDVLDDVGNVLEEAAAIGAGLTASDVRELLANFLDYRGQYAQLVAFDGRMNDAVVALLLELRHPTTRR